MTVETVNQKAVNVSIICGFIIAVVGIITGLILSSQVILFSAITSFIGGIVTLIPLVSLRFIKKKDVHKYPFGKETLEPFIAIMQYLPLLFICIYNIFTAIRVILGGGNAVNATSGMLYGLFVTVFHISVCIYLIRLTKMQSSAIAEAEVMGWKFESAIGTGILLGFGIAWLLSAFSLTGAIPYVDPILTLIIFLILMVVTVITFVDCMKELMQSRPSEAIANDIIDKIENVDTGLEFSDKVLRLGKVGSKIMIEIDYVVQGGSKLDSVFEQDQLRGRFAKIFSKLPYRVWLNIGFTSDTKLTEHIITR